MGNRGISASLILVLLMIWVASCSTPYGPPSVSEYSSSASAEHVVKGGEESFNKKLLMALGKIKQREYRLMPGDIVEVSVFGIKELKELTGAIDALNKVSLPLVGNVKIGGLTIPEAKKVLTDEFKEYVENPQVSLIIKEYHGYRVSVLGEVNKPDVYSLRGTRTVLDGIAMASGLTPEASRTVILTHMGPEKRSVTYINLDDLVKRWDLSEDLMLQPGDIIYVPKAKHIYVDGFVKNPSAYPITEPITVTRAISSAGGMLIDADPSNVAIYRKLNTGKKEIIHVNVNEIRNGREKDVMLKPDDIVVVPSSGLKVFVYRFFGIGVTPTGGAVRAGGR